MQSKRHYIAKETRVSFLANFLVNSVVVWLIFQGRSEVSLFGGGGVAIDFIPQLAAIAFIGSVVPALITRSRLKRGKVGAEGEAAPMSLAALVRNSVRTAACVMLALGAASTVILAAVWPGPYTFAQVFAIKSIVACIVPFITTPLAIGWVLSTPSDGAASN